MKFSTAAILVATVASASAFAPQPTFKVTSALGMEKGAGGMFDTRDPAAMDHEDPRKSISAAPSFEEYMKNRGGGAAPAPAAAAPVAAAPVAAAPVAAAPVAAAAPAGGFVYGEYDDQLWSHEAKKDVYAKWDPNSPRSTRNFNPFETFEGNSPDASGIYPGEQRYKDPQRPDVSYAIMQAEKVDLDAMAANPKAAPGCVGCKSGKGGNAPVVSGPPPIGAAPVAAAPVAAAPAPVAAAPAPVAAAPVAAGGSAIDVLRTLDGPGVVWGAEGVMTGHEESELKEYDNYDKFVAALESTGVASEIAGAGPFTIFALTNSAMGTYEAMRGAPDAQMLRMQIVPGLVASSDVRGNLQSLGGELNYRYAVRKHFVNDVIIGEISFGPYPDSPVDVPCSNGVIHSVNNCFALY